MFDDVYVNSSTVMYIVIMLSSSVSCLLLLKQVVNYLGSTLLNKTDTTYKNLSRYREMLCCSIWP